jgi:hypothetical protein
MHIRCLLLRLTEKLKPEFLVDSPLLYKSPH